MEAEDIDLEGELEAEAAAAAPRPRFDAAPDGSLAVFEGGVDDPVHILRPNGSKYKIPKSSRAVLDPGRTGRRTYWSRSTVLRRCQALGFSVEWKVSEEWVGVDVEGELEAAAAAAAVSLFEAAPEGTLAVLEGGGDDDPVHILRPHGSRFYIPLLHP
jgi:hypothetical protein